MSAPPAATIRVRGAVQGVGFRPFVWRLAQIHQIDGVVSNDAEGVLIHAAGDALDAFVAAIAAEAPPLARIAAIERAPCADPPDVAGFHIGATTAGLTRTEISPDAAVCADCLAEIADPRERRHRYAFANCTHCGPRFSIIDYAPYDRAATSMAAFSMCGDCRAEYENPADRRFHAQPIACPACGPQLWLEVGGAPVPGDAIDEAAARLRAGACLAIKGIGGFHLACDATDAAAVATLRARKRRPAKPLALMATDAAMIARYCAVTDADTALLADPAAPIVVLRRRGDAAGLPDAVAPGLDRIGWMLPYTPLHRLLLDAVGRPLVMTSGNLSGEPQAIDNDEARAKLAAFADGFLMHDRRIARRLDDSVVRSFRGTTQTLRRARGYAPRTTALPPGFADAPPIAAYGGELKAAICLSRDGRALLSHHLGDLEDPLAFDEFERAIADYAQLFDHAPAAMAADLHPGYRSTESAATAAARMGLPLVQVQHHHAHIAAAMAENGWPRDGGRVLGLALDGSGFGPDETVWGCELLLCDYAEFQRVARLRPTPLPGGPAAVVEPWRNLFAQLNAAFGWDEAAALVSDTPLAARLVEKPIAPLRAMIAKGVNTPHSSSAGRLFDAVGAALGLAFDRLSYEGQAAQEAEALAVAAVEAGEDNGYRFDRRAGPDGMIDLDPTPLWRALIADLRDGVPAARIAARFHLGFADALAALAVDRAQAFDAGAIALSGGVMQNALLFERLVDRLRQAGAPPLLTHSAIPANDGGLAFGQVAVAAARLLES